MVSVKEHVEKLKGKIKLYRPKNDGRISFDSISPKNLSPVYLTERPMLFRTGSNSGKENWFDLTARRLKDRELSFELEKISSSSEDFSEHER